MALTVLAEATASAACNAVVDLIDVGVAGAGYMELCDGEDALAHGHFAAAAFGAASAGVATKGTIADLTATAAGTADNLKVYDGDGALIMTVEVAAGVTPVAGKCVITNVVIAIGDVIPIASWTHTQPLAA